MKRASYPFVVVLILAAFFLLTFSPVSSAAEDLYATKKPEVIYNPVYLGAFGGWVIPDDLRVEEYGEKDKIQLDNSWTAGAKIGFIFPFQWLACELEYSYLNDQDVADSSMNEYYKANNLMANLILRYPKGVIRPYIGAGAGWSWAEFGSDDESESYDDFGWQALAGINVKILPSLSVDFGYRFFRGDYEIDDVTDAAIEDHMVLLGLNYHFGGAKPLPPPPPAQAAVEEKKCPNTPACCIVDSDGCPFDADKDGVCDGCDNCIDTPDGCPVDAEGCPVDSDKDGVIDCLDKCPKTPAGVTVDKNGCPPAAPVVKEDQPKIEKEIVEKGRTTLNILFDFDKATIRKGSFKDIDALAVVMKKYKDINITIEGHTDNKGTAAYNKKLSQQRADTVKKYLVEEAGIDAKRLTAKGFGFEKPVASNATQEGRQKNRRVEAAADYIIKK
ncbi:MAG TPA: OmpA family protein [Smithella sp.]|nr:OmpA family protein [Smithella sp.]